MDKFTVLESTCIPFLRDDVDTDQIIPARFLKGTSKAGLGKVMFYDWRYDEHGNVRPDSLFDSPTYAGSQVLIARHNFGCGSSREHAPWSLKDYGIRVILAVSFADIFYNNALKNFLLPVALEESVILALAKQVEANPSLTIRVDLPEQQVIIPNQGRFSFDINGFRKKCLVEGLDDIAYVLSYLPKIEAFEAERAISQA